jgi:hypothetical protein
MEQITKADIRLIVREEIDHALKMFKLQLQGEETSRRIDELIKSLDREKEEREGAKNA